MRSMRRLLLGRLKSERLPKLQLVAKMMILMLLVLVQSCPTRRNRLIRLNIWDKCEMIMTLI